MWKETKSLAFWMFGDHHELKLGLLWSNSKFWGLDMKLSATTIPVEPKSKHSRLVLPLCIQITTSLFFFFPSTSSPSWLFVHPVNVGFNSILSHLWFFKPPPLSDSLFNWFEKPSNTVFSPWYKIDHWLLTILYCYWVYIYSSLFFYKCYNEN